MSQRYKIYYNGNSIYEPGNSLLQVIDPVLSLEVSAAGSLEMTVPPGNSYAGLISETGEVRVTDSTEGGKTIWSGRVTECEIDMYGRRHIYAEGALAWLQDSLQLSGATYTGTIESILQSLISIHNMQVRETNRQFSPVVSVIGMPSGTYTRDTDDSCTLDEIRKFFIEPLGGYLLMTYFSNSQSERPTLSYIGAFTSQCGQTIELGKNLLDYMRRTSTADIVTAVVPRGADGLQGDPVYSSAVSTYGYRYKILTFSDVTDRTELETLARNYLSSGQWAEAQYEISAADLHGIQDVDPIQLGDLVHVTSSYHGIDTWLPVTAMTIRLDSAAQQFTLGTLERQELTAYQRREREEIQEDMDDVAASAAAAAAAANEHPIKVINEAAFDPSMTYPEGTVVLVVEDSTS